MANSTYSFKDVQATFQHPAVGVYPINGSGVGEFNVSWADDNTVNERAADGSVMTSKVFGNNGTITISMQQTSPFHDWLKNYFNVVLNTTALTWTAGLMNITDLVNGDLVFATGVAPTKRPDQPYQQQGQMVTWSFSCQQIQIQ